MRALAFVCAECTSLVVLVNTRTRSCAEAVERDLLVVYALIDIRDCRYNLHVSASIRVTAQCSEYFDYNF